MVWTFFRHFGENWFPTRAGAGHFSKNMIKLANKPVKTINIPFHIYPGKNLQSSKNIKKVTKNMSKKNKKLYRKLRQKYKDI